MKTTLLLSVLCAAMAGVAASVPCGGDTCADDEICDIDTTCRCNSSLYSITGDLPSPNYTCTGSKFNIQVSKCWLEAHGYNTSNMRLNSTNPECVAVKQVVDGISQMTFHRPLMTSDCNTDTATNSSHITYTNQLNIFAKTDPHKIADDFVMNISCSEPLNVNPSPNVILGTVVLNNLIADGRYSVSMLAYKDNQFITLVSDSAPLYVEDIIYISVVVPDLDAKTLNLKVVNIYASPENSSSTKYYLLWNGCPVIEKSDDELTVESNGVGTEARFAMKVFKIASSYTIYLFAEVVLCVSNCNSTCSSQSRSEVAQPIAGRVGIFLGAVPDDYYKYDGNSASGFSMPWTFSALIFSCILVKLM